MNDSDGDGLPNAWETGTAGAGEPNLEPYGAKPDAKDLFLHVGPTKTGSTVRMPNIAAITRIQNAFKARGINLHVDAGPGSIMDPATGRTWGALSKMAAPVEFPANWDITYSTPGVFGGAYASAKAVLLPAERLKTFHFVLYAGRYNNGYSGGVAWMPGSELLLAHDAFSVWGGGRPTELEEASTVMHEFGHNLSLNHGGGGPNAAQNYQPNYPSIMNYIYSFSGLYRDGVSGVLDYSEGTLPTLDENALNEKDGLTNDPVSSRYQIKWLLPGTTTEKGPSPAVSDVDWNGNGSISAANFAQRLARNEAGGETLTTLRDFSDWPGVAYGGGGYLGAGATVSGGPLASPGDAVLNRGASVPYLRSLASEVITVGLKAAPVVELTPGGTRTSTVTLSNSAGAPRSYTLSGQGSDTDLTVSVSPSSVTIPAGGSVVVTATSALRAGADPNVVRTAQVRAATTDATNLQDHTQLTMAVAIGGAVPRGQAIPESPQVVGPLAPPSDSSSTASRTPNDPNSPPRGRLGGSDRYQSALALSRAAFPGRADAVVVAAGTTYADALAGGVLAAKVGGPLLLVDRRGLTADLAAELRRLAPSQVYLMGGTSAVGGALQDTLGALTGVAVRRTAGPDRYATAAAAAAAWDRAATVYLATGEGFPDALSGGTAAARQGMPLLLASRDGLPEVTASALTRLAPSRIVLVGGTAVLSARTEALIRSAVPAAAVERLAGSDRYATSALVIGSVTGAGATAALIASGQNFPDALAAAPAAARWKVPVALAARGCLPAPVHERLASIATADRLLLGGPGALSERAADTRCRVGE